MIQTRLKNIFVTLSFKVEMLFCGPNVSGLTDLKLQTCCSQNKTRDKYVTCTFIYVEHACYRIHSSKHMFIVNYCY